jgi:hypothetical protein
VEEIVHHHELLACVVPAGDGRGHGDPGLTKSCESWQIEGTIDLRNVSDEQDDLPYWGHTKRVQEFHVKGWWLKAW